jgi:hypothetical protein
MKSKMKIQRQTELPRFIVGALATAGASAANGATVQITFNNSFISSTAGKQLDTDFGGDGVAEGFNAMTGIGYARIYAVGFGYLGNARQALNYQGVSYGFASVGGVYAIGAPGGSATVSRVTPFSITDANVRGGLPTVGWLGVTATGRVSGEQGRVEWHRFIFDASTGVAPVGVSHADTAYPEYVAAVPEPGSNLALLALGAGGLTLRRRLKRAA